MLRHLARHVTIEVVGAVAGVAAAVWAVKRFKHGAAPPGVHVTPSGSTPSAQQNAQPGSTISGQDYWNGLSQVQRSQYIQGLFDWLAANPSTPDVQSIYQVPGGVSIPTDLLDSGNLAIATDAFQTANGIGGGGIIDAATYQAAVAIG